MRLLKLAGVGAGVVILGLACTEIYLRAKYSRERMRYGESMTLINERKFLDEREDILTGLNSDLCDYVRTKGYGIAMPRNDNQEEYFKKYGVEMVSIKSEKGDKLSDLSYLFYKDSCEWYNSKFFNKELMHYAPNQLLPEGLEIKTHMLPNQLSQYRSDFPEREIEISLNNSFAPH